MVSRRVFIQSTALCAASIASRSWPARAAYLPGISDTEIKFGQSMPYSGPASSYSTIGRAEAAYFKMTNDMGGVNNRKLNFVSVDDGYTAPKTVEQTRRLVEEEHVAFIFGTLGGFTNVAIRAYLNENKVPQLFCATAADLIDDPQRYPWTLGFNPAIITEARIYAERILATKPDAKIGVIYQNDQLGKTFLAGTSEGLGEKHAGMIVKAVSYEVSDPTVDSQVVTLQAAGVDTLIIAATPKAAAQTIRKAYDIGWMPDRYLFFGSASIAATLRPAGLEKSKGLITAGYIKDPTDARWKNDPGYKEWAAFVAKYLTPADLTDGVAAYGYSVAAVMVQVLRQCGDDLSRENIMRQATHINELELPMLLPGVKVNTSPDNLFPIRQVYLSRFNGESWDLFGELLKD